MSDRNRPQISDGHGKQLGIAAKLGLFASILVVVSVGAVGLWTYLRLNNALVKEETRDLSTRAQVGGVRFVSRLEALRQDVLFVAGTPLKWRGADNGIW